MQEYKNEITKLYNKFSHNEQEQLHKRMKRGDMRARNHLINSCLPLVVKIAEKFSINNKHIDMEDMIQEGNIALINAIDHWDAERGRLTTVASNFIKNALIDMINDSRYNVTTPYTMSRSAAEDLRKIKALDTDDLEEIYKQTQIKPRRAKRLLRNRVSRVGMEFVDPEEKQDPVVKSCLADLYELWEKNLEGIDKKVFGLYIGVGGGRKTIRAICRELNMTEQDVRSIIKKSKTKLKKVAHA